jgi:hypothetical protein
MRIAVTENRSPYPRPKGKRIRSSTGKNQKRSMNCGKGRWIESKLSCPRPTRRSEGAVNLEDRSMAYSATIFGVAADRLQTNAQNSGCGALQVPCTRFIAVIEMM